jgi:hypothetical protein
MTKASRTTRRERRGTRAPTSSVVAAADRIERAILVLRGHKVMLDTDLAALYGVAVKALNQAVLRNSERFPQDFMFQLTRDEVQSLRSQTVILDAGPGAAGSLRSQDVTLDTGRGRHRKYLPYAFTEQGVAMLSSVLRSPRAVRVNVEIMRAFVRLRAIVASTADLARRLDAMEKTYDGRFKVVFAAIRGLMAPLERPQRRIGFRAD